LLYHFFYALHGAIEIVEIVAHTFNEVITYALFGTTVFKTGFVYLHLVTILILNFIADLIT